MKLRIVGIEEPGVVNRERLHLFATESAELQYFLVLATYSPATGTIASGSVTAFWFPPIRVALNDHVFLFTGRGTMSTQKAESGSTLYSFYWGMEQTIWDMPTRGASLVEAQGWETRFLVPS